MTYGIIGGDIRNRYLASIIEKKGKKVFVYKDYDIYTINKNVKTITDMDTFLESSDTIVTGIPYARENNIYAPFLNVEINKENFANKIKNKIIVGGLIETGIQKILDENHNKVLDLLDLNTFAIYNAIATAEGVIGMLIQKSKINIFNSNILVLGYGRCGSILSNKLKAMGGNVSVAVRRNEQVAVLATSGLEYQNYKTISKDIEKYDFIINTVEAPLIDNEVISRINKETLIIDIASGRGGVDFEAAKIHKIEAIHYLGIPGKISPLTSAMYMYKIINEILEV